MLGHDDRLHGAGAGPDSDPDALGPVRSDHVPGHPVDDVGREAANGDIVPVGTAAATPGRTPDATMYWHWCVAIRNPAARP